MMNFKGSCYEQEIIWGGCGGRLPTQFHIGS